MGINSWLVLFALYLQSLFSFLCYLEINRHYIIFLISLARGMLILLIFLNKTGFSLTDFYCFSCFLLISVLIYIYIYFFFFAFIEFKLLFFCKVITTQVIGLRPFSNVDIQYCTLSCKYCFTGISYIGYVVFSFNLNYFLIFLFISLTHTFSVAVFQKHAIQCSRFRDFPVILLLISNLIPLYQKIYGSFLCIRIWFKLMFHMHLKITCISLLLGAVRAC